jgi:hypothetical protein
MGCPWFFLRREVLENLEGVIDNHPSSSRPNKLRRKVQRYVVHGLELQIRDTKKTGIRV